MAAASGDLYGWSRPSALSVSIDGRPIPYRTLACGEFFSARMRLTASPADRRRNVGLMPVLFSKPCATAVQVFSGGPIYNVTLPAPWVRAAMGSVDAAPASSIPVNRLRVIRSIGLLHGHLYMSHSYCPKTPTCGQEQFALAVRTVLVMFPVAT